VCSAFFTCVELLHQVGRSIAGKDYIVGFSYICNTCSRRGGSAHNTDQRARPGHNFLTPCWKETLPAD